MPEEQLKAFLEKVKGDTSLQEKLKAASDLESIIAIAKDTGLSFSTDDIKKVKSEISDAELEAAAGGLNPIDAKISINNPLVCHILYPENEG